MTRYRHTVRPNFPKFRLTLALKNFPIRSRQGRLFSICSDVRRESRRARAERKDGSELATGAEPGERKNDIRRDAILRDGFAKALIKGATIAK